MVPTLIIAITTFVLITLSILVLPHIQIGKFRLDTYWIVALLGAVILLSAQLAPIDEVFHQLTSDAAINPLKVLVLFFSMTVISIFLDEFGLFHYLAALATKKAKGNQVALFFAIYVLTSVLTVFTSNDIVILTLTPFLCFFCKNTKINPLPYLIAEFAAANTWSLMLVIGNPTNIYLATSAGIDFLAYFRVMALPTLVAGAVELGILYLIFHRQLKKPMTLVPEEYHVESKFDLLMGLGNLLVCLLFLIISNLVGIEMWVVSAFCASTLVLFVIIDRLITKKNWKCLTDTLKRLPYPLIPFFLSMFVIVVAFNHQGITQRLGEFLGSIHPVWVYGYSSLLASNVINNIPMSILYSNLPVALEGLSFKQAIYATIVGSNIGAFLTPIGALAGIMFSGLVHKYEVKFTFLDFIKYGTAIAVPTITAALGMLLAVSNWM